MATRSSPDAPASRQTHQMSEPTKNGHRSLAFILAVLFLDLLGTSILGPVQAYIIREYSTSALVVGLLSVTFSGAQFVAAPVLGLLSDRYGRRPLLLICLLGSAIGGYTFGFGGGLWVFFLSRLIDGMSGGNVSIAQAYIADITSPQNRARNFGLVGATFGLTFVLGPVVGGIVSQLNATLPAFVSGTLSLFSAAIAYFTLPESLPISTRASGPFGWKEVDPFKAVVDAFKLPGLGSLFLAVFGFNLAFNAMTNNIPVFLLERFGAGPLDNAGLFVTVGIIQIAVQGGVVGRLVPRLGEKRVALVGLAAQAAGYLGIVWATSLWMLYPITVLTTIGIALVMPTLSTLISNSVSAREQGQVSGTSTALTGLSSVMGPLWAGLTYDYLMPSAPYWTSALLIITTAVLLAWTVRGVTPSAPSTD